MVKRFSIQELLTFAIDIEQEGINFYSGLAEKAKDPSLKEFYIFLKNEEEKHKRIFQDELLPNAIQEIDQPYFSDEYYIYLNSMVETTVFNSNDSKIQDLANDADAIDYAIGKEKDSILFYMEIKQFLPENDWAFVDKIIEEERLHIIKLLSIKEQIN